MEDRSFKLKDDYVLKVVQDTDPQSPNDWDNQEMFLVYDHNQFYVKVEGFEPSDIFEYLTDKHTPIEDNEDGDIGYINDRFDKWYIYPVYAYIHSGVSLSLGKDSYPFNDRFDVSFKGFILVLKETEDTITTPEEAVEYAESLIVDWNTYLSGDVYTFELYKLETCSCCNHTEETLEDSCSGFYGSTDEDLLMDILGNIDKKLYIDDTHKTVAEAAQSLLLKGD